MGWFSYFLIIIAIIVFISLISLLILKSKNKKDDSSITNSFQKELNNTRKSRVQYRQEKYFKEYNHLLSNIDTAVRNQVLVANQKGLRKTTIKCGVRAIHVNNDDVLKESDYINMAKKAVIATLNKLGLKYTSIHSLHMGHGDDYSGYDTVGVSVTIRW